MIKVILTYHKDQVSSIQITGHAQSGPYGQDIVCAGVSVASIGALNALDVLCH
ncbi:ribosomal-processing cysteine protease Prp, partial [Faecalicoccus sp.]